jgi:hypothetical protein
MDLRRALEIANRCVRRRSSRPTSHSESCLSKTNATLTTFTAGSLSAKQTQRHYAGVAKLLLPWMPGAACEGKNPGAGFALVSIRT